jgi:hypothetical protein
MKESVRLGAYKNFDGNLVSFPQGTTEINAINYPQLQNFGTGTPGTDYYEFAPLINAAPEDVSFHYDVIPAGPAGSPTVFKILRADLNAHDELTFAADLALDIPLKLNAGTIDLNELLDIEDEDLIGDTSEFDDAREFLDSLVSMTLTVNYTNSLLSLAPGETLDVTITTLSGFNKQLSLSGTTGTIPVEFTRSDIEDHILGGSFKPTIELVIPAGGAGLRRNGEFEVTMSFTTALDINTTYDLSDLAGDM